MAVIQYLDTHGVATLVQQIKRHTANIYKIKGSAIYADQNYVDEAAAGTMGYEADIDAVGLWQDIDGTWTHITDVTPGWVYNIDNRFTTDADFIEGAGNAIEAGINIVAVNTGTDDAPAMKWDLLAMGTNLDEYQTKRLLAPLTVFTNQTPTVYATAADLPAQEAKASATITDMMVAILGTGDAYRALVTTNAADDTKNDITWVKLGDQLTVEGALAFLGAIAPNTPISDAEIIAMFND